MSDAALRAAAGRAGLMTVWRDVTGQERSVAPDVLRRLLDVLGPASATRPPLLTADAGAATLLPLPAGPARLVLEDGTARELRLDAGEGGAWLPAVEVPGYHRLAAGDAGVTLAVAPPRCWTVADACEGRRAWGLAVQIYGLREAGSGGIGGFAAAGDLARQAAARGADAIAISPVHAQFAADPDRFSPYAPSSRVHLNALHADMAGCAGEVPADEPAITAELLRLEALELLDWPAASRVRMHRLRRLFAALPAAGQAAFAAFRARGGEALESHATFEAAHAAQLAISPARWNWRTWPEGLRHREPAAMAAFAATNRAGIAFHAFAQFLADRSLAEAQAGARAAGMGIGLIADIAVGVDAGGSDAWANPGELLHGISIGAPPDVFNAAGQSWGVTSFAPAGLVASGYRGFLAMLRAAMRNAGGVRIDHVMGLARLWLVPDGAGPADGCYLRYPAEDLLRLVRLESWRHRAVVIGEDLGTLPDGFRERLEAMGVAGMRVLWFERGHDHYTDPRHWSPPAVAMTSTHDLPTLAGWWRGTDLGWRERLGICGGGGTDARAHDRWLLWNACGGGAAMPDMDADGARRFATAASTHTGRAACTLALLPLEDALALEEQPNLPGTVSEHPNWRRRYPADPLDASDAPERLAAFAQARTEGV